MNKKRKKSFQLWMSTVIEIYNALPDIPVLACPSCHKVGVDFQFVGDLQIKIGYVAVWCPFCLHGIHISRVHIPEETQALSFKTSAAGISGRIPNFTHVKP